MKKSILVLKVLALCIKDEEKIEILDFLTNRITELEDDGKKYLEVNSNGDYKWLYNKISNDYQTVVDVLKDMEDEMYKQFRLASIVTLDNMKDEQLIEFYQKVKELLINFDNVEEAAEYICFHSGAELTDFMSLMIHYIKEEENGRTKKLIPLTYLEEHQTILTLTLKEWVDIFNHLRYSMKYLTICSNKNYKTLTTKYSKLILYYFIIITSTNFNQ